MLKHLNKLTLILVVFGADLILYAYLCGFFYSKSNSAFKSFPLINFFVGKNPFTRFKIIILF
jgi:hypothetical protein